MFKHKLILLLSAILLSTVSYADRIKDLVDVGGVRPNKLIGFGLVVGLQGSGDGKDLPITAQALKHPITISKLINLNDFIAKPISCY